MVLLVPDNHQLSHHLPLVEYWGPVRGRKGLPRWLGGKESACDAEDAVDLGSVPGWRRSSGGGHGNPLQASILAWRIPWTEDPGSLQSIRSQKVRHG